MLLKYIYIWVTKTIRKLNIQVFNNIKINQIYFLNHMILVSIIRLFFKLYFYKKE